MLVLDEEDDDGIVSGSCLRAKRKKKPECRDLYRLRSLPRDILGWSEKSRDRVEEAKLIDGLLIGAQRRCSSCSNLFKGI